MADFPPSQVFWWIFRHNKTMEKINVGKNIKVLRVNNKLSQKKFGELFGDLIDRETKYGRFEFTDRYFDNVSKEEIQAVFDSIWDD